MPANPVILRYAPGMRPASVRIRDGFSLIELLVVVSIIAMLASFLFAGIGLVREAAKSTRCQASLRQVAMAGLSYLEDHEGYHCPTQGYLDGHFGGALLNETQYWMQFLAPYAADENAGMYSVTYLKAGASRSSVFKGCPSAAERFQPWNYLGSNVPSRFGHGMNPSKTLVNGKPVDGFDDLYTYRNGGPYSATSLFGWRFFHNAQVSHPAARVWIGDSVIDSLFPEKTGVRSYQSNRTYTHWNLIPWADLRYEDHLANADPLRHRGRSCHVFFDGHTAALLPTALAQAFCAPDLAP